MRSKSKIQVVPLVGAISLAIISHSFSQALVGSWFISKAGQAKSDAVITFLANGTYTMAEDGNRRRDPNGKDGMERGTYTWNPSTKAIKTKTLVDTTREWGLSDTKLKTASVSGNKLTLKAADGKFTFNRVTSKSNPLVGGWYIKTGRRNYAVITFLPNGSYFFVQDGKPEGGGRTGMERGTYVWNRFSKSLYRKINVDTNGTWGLSDARKRSVVVSGNKLKLKVQGEGKFRLSRVVSSK